MNKKPQRKLTIIPVTLPVANTYIEKWHRHHAYRVITYTLETESGTSLRAAGFIEDRRGILSCWLKGKGKAIKGGAGNSVWREHMNVKKVGWSKQIRTITSVVLEREFSYSGPDKRKHAVRPKDESLPRDVSVAQPHGTAPLLEPWETDR